MNRYLKRDNKQKENKQKQNKINKNKTWFNGHLSAIE